MDNFISIGTYDGVHLGHRKIIQTVMREALRRGMRSTIVYFPVPPKFFFSGEAENCLITLPEERQAMIAALRPDAVEALPFDGKLAVTPAARFFSEVVLGRFRAGGLCVGPDFAVGRNREGHSDFLAAACAAAGVTFRKMAFLCRGGHRISSSLVRSLLRAGDVAEANRCLGWDYFVEGPVLRGAGLGRKLGFPTANIGAHPAKILPPGIFAARVRVDGEVFGAVVSVGRRPTLNTLGGRLIAEAHILGFSKMIYGRRIRVTFLKHIRAERKFGSKEALVERIRADIAEAREHLGRAA